MNFIFKQREVARPFVAVDRNYAAGSISELTDLPLSSTVGLRQCRFLVKSPVQGKSAPVQGKNAKIARENRD